MTQVREILEASAADDPEAKAAIREAINVDKVLLHTLDLEVDEHDPARWSPQVISAIGRAWVAKGKQLENVRAPYDADIEVLRAQIADIEADRDYRVAAFDNDRKRLWSMLRRWAEANRPTKGKTIHTPAVTMRFRKGRPTGAVTDHDAAVAWIEQARLRLQARLIELEAEGGGAEENGELGELVELEKTLAGAIKRTAYVDPLKQYVAKTKEVPDGFEFHPGSESFSVSPTKRPEED